MDMMEHVRRLFAYTDWANRETLASLKMAAAPPARALKFMSHIIAAERLWLDRLKPGKNKVVVWPELTLDECEAQVTELAQLWQDYLSDLNPSELRQTVTYTNSKGEPWENAVEDILMHVVMHSVYHRGQIASDLRASGDTPPYTDFIHCVRQGFVE